MWNLKYDTKKLTDKTETGSQTENRFVVTKGKRSGGGVNQEFRISRDKYIQNG